MTATDAPPQPEATPAATESRAERRSEGAPPKTRGKVRSPPPPTIRSSRVVIRRLDPWSVLKVSILFYLSLCIVLLVAGVMLWAGARSVGVIGNIESFMDSIGFTDFEFRAGQILRGSALGGMVLVVAGTFGNVLMATLYNLINDVVGGLKVTLAEDERPRRRV
jgi:hypothetical protein